MHIIRLLFGMAFVAVVLVLGAAGAAVWYFDRDLPDFKQLADYQPPITTRVYAGDGSLLAEFSFEKRVFMPVKAMPRLVTEAFIAAEDREFYTHPGINLLSMARAGLTDIGRIREKRRPVGASTITQQVAKNFFLGNEVSVKRKIKEALVALRMEKVLSKDRILELYLNEIYLGRGSYGVAAASLTYFNKALDELSVADMAFLAALPKAPNSYNPFRHPEAALERRNWVIDRMKDEGFITEAQATQAKAEPIHAVKRGQSDTANAPYFAEEVRRTLYARYGDKALYQGGLTVHTSLDPKYQALADKVMRDGLIAYDRRHGWRGVVQHLSASAGADWKKALAAIPPVPGASDVNWKLAYVISTDGEGANIGFADGTTGRIPMAEIKWARRDLGDKRGLGPQPARPSDVVNTGDVVLTDATPAPGGYGLRQIPEVSGAMVVIDPHSGRVLAISGGFSYAISQFDRATQAHRQIGSAIKPFVYVAAFEHGFTPSSQLLDEPVVIDQGPGLPKWKPSNYTHKFYGLLSLRVGVEQSRNLITARLGQTIGLEAVGHSLESFGIMDHMPREYSMVLGAGETTPLRLTAAYAMLVNGGKKLYPTLIDRIQDRNGVTLYRADRRQCQCTNIDYHGQPAPELPDTREAVVDPQSAYQMVSVMQGVVQYGTGHSVAAVGKPLAGKTGTTNDSRDTWFLGFSPDLAAGVFVGFDQPRTLGGHETGGSVAAPIFRDFMMTALKDKPSTPFRIPPGLRLVRVDHATGQLPPPGDKNVILEAFKPGTEPTSTESEAALALNIGDDEDAASLAPANIDDGSPRTTASAVPNVSIPIQIMPQNGPQSGTGGLY